MTAFRRVSKLRQLDDVPAAAPADGQVPAYDLATDTFAWADSGGGTSTQTATVSTDPDSYDCSHIFDLGGCAIVSVTTTLTTFTGDGETLGSAPGDIQLAVDVGASFDGVTFLGGGTGGPTLQDIGTLTALSMVQQRGPTSLRYLKILCAWDDSDFNAYAGPNHPVGTVHIVVEYIAT